MTDTFNINFIVENLPDEPYPSILLYQCLETRPIAEKIDRLSKAGKNVVDCYIMGVLGKSLNNRLIDRHGIEKFVDIVILITEYISGGSITFPNWICKPNWLSKTNRQKLIDYCGTEEKE
jgi:hypothetical protein